MLASGLNLRSSQLLRPRTTAGSRVAIAHRRPHGALLIRAAADPTISQPPAPIAGGGDGSATSVAPPAPSADATPATSTTAASTTAAPVTSGTTAGATISAAAAPAPAAPAAAAVPGSGSTPSPAAGPVKAVNEDFKGDMLQPSLINSPFVRAGAVLTAVAAVAASTVLLPNAVGAFLHVTSYGILLGTQLWNTFFVGITMFKNLPRQTFGRVQAKMFPQYFALTASANALALATLVLAGAATTPAGSRSLAALALSLGGLVANWLYVEPITTRLMFERYDIENLPEKTDADKERVAVLYKKFGQWHGISSLINLVAFCVVVAHGWFLATLLVTGA